MFDVAASTDEKPYFFHTFRWRSLPVLRRQLGGAGSAPLRYSERLPAERPIDDLTLAAEQAWRRSRKIVILILGITIVFIAVVGLQQYQLRVKGRDYA